MRAKAHIGLIVFEVTDACNQSCKFCYNHWKAADNSPTTSAPDYKLASRTLRKIQKEVKVDNISFSGGEPMLLSRIHELVLQARFKGSNVSILTNATRLSNEDIDTFLALGVGRIQIPILSHDKNIHDGITQLRGSWEECTKAAKYVVKRDSGRFSAVMILSKQNKDSFGKTLQMYRDMGIGSLLLNRFNIGGLGMRYADELVLSHDELRGLFGIANNFAKENDFKISSGVCTPICVLNPAHYPHIAFSFCNTNIKSRPLTINYKGDVRFCNHSPKVLGNIYDRKLSDILNEVESNSPYTHHIPDFCNECKHWERCKGGCRAASEQLYGTFERVDPILSL